MIKIISEFVVYIYFLIITVNFFILFHLRTLIVISYILNYYFNFKFKIMKDGIGNYYYLNFFFSEWKLFGKTNN